MVAPSDKRLVAVATRVVAVLVVGSVLGLLAESACKVSTGSPSDADSKSTLSDTAVVRAGIDTCKRNGFRDVGDGTLEGTCITSKSTCQVRDIGARVVCYDLSAADRANGIEARCTASFNYIRRTQQSGTWQEWVDVGNESLLGWDLQKRSGRWEATLEGLARVVPYQPLDSVSDSICR